MRAESLKLFVEASALWDAGDHKAAAALFRRGALHNDGDSQLNLGYFYHIGLGVRRNPRAAMQWYRRAARQGNCSAANNIATIHRDQGNHRRAIEWFRRAMKQGCASSAVTLGTLLLTLGRDADTKQVLNWAYKHRQALSEGDCEQLESLARRLVSKAKEFSRPRRKRARLIRR